MYNAVQYESFIFFFFKSMYNCEQIFDLIRHLTHQNRINPLKYFLLSNLLPFNVKLFYIFFLWQKIELYRMDLSKVHFYVEAVLFISRSFPKPSCYRLFNLSELYLVFSFLKDRHFYSIKMNVCTCMYFHLNFALNFMV